MKKSFKTIQVSSTHLPLLFASRHPSMASCSSPLLWWCSTVHQEGKPAATSVVPPRQHPQKGHEDPSHQGGATSLEISSDALPTERFRLISPPGPLHPMAHKDCAQWRPQTRSNMFGARVCKIAVYKYAMLWGGWFQHLLQYVIWDFGCSMDERTSLCEYLWTPCISVYVSHVGMFHLNVLCSQCDNECMCVCACASKPVNKRACRI